MNRPYREMFDNLPASDALRQEVLNMTTKERTSKRVFRLPKAAIAAITAVLLVGTAFAANLFSVRDLFAEKWQEETGNAISVDQLGLIDRLTQEIGASDTDNGITVTVDSVTRGEGILWMLLRIDGELPVAERGNFHTKPGLTFSPELKTAGFVYSFEETAVREDGSLMTLLRFVPPLTGETTLLDRYDAVLSLKDLYWNDNLAAEGTWEIEFSLDAMENTETLTLEEPVIVRGISLTDPAPVEVEFYDVRITPTEIWLSTDTPLGDETMVLGEWGLQMEDGSEIVHSGGATYDRSGGMESVYYWRVPVDLSQVTAVTFGDTVIPVS